MKRKLHQKFAERMLWMLTMFTVLGPGPQLQRTLETLPPKKQPAWLFPRVTNLYLLLIWDLRNTRPAAHSSNCTCRQMTGNLKFGSTSRSCSTEHSKQSLSQSSASMLGGGIYLLPVSWQGTAAGSQSIVIHTGMAGHESESNQGCLLYDLSFLSRSTITDSTATCSHTMLSLQLGQAMLCCSG